jgi:site-specific recombinase XerD
MDLEHVSVEKSEYHENYYPADPDKSTILCAKETRSGSEQKVSSREIVRVLGEIAHKELIGQDHVREYLHELYCRNCRPNTIRGNGTAIILFLSFLKATGRTLLETITRDDVSAFIEHEQDRGLTANTVSTRLRSLYAFFRFLIDRDVIHPDVLKRKMRIKVPDALPRAIDPDDIQRLLEVLDKPRDRALILALLRTGMRIGELLNTKLRDLNLKEKLIEIFEAQKNRTGRVVYLSADACRALKKWLRLKNPQTQYLFYGRGGRALTYAAARCIFNRYMDKAGLSHKGYTLHSLRHTCATELLNAGMPLECLQPLLGHQCIEMTRRYARLTDNTRREQYYKAMEIIERGHTNDSYRFDPQLP